MKKLFQTLTAAITITSIVCISACNKEISAKYDMPDYEYCIPAQQYASSKGLIQYFPLDKDKINETLKAASITTTKGVTIDKAILNKITFKTSGANNFFGSIAKGAQGFVVNSHSMPLTSDNMVAYTNTDIPADATEVELSVSGIDIKDFLTNSDSAYLVLKVWNIDNSPAACLKLSKGEISFNAKK